MIPRVSLSSLLVISCVLANAFARSPDGRLERRQLDFDSVNESSEIPVFGRRITSSTKKKEEKSPLSTGSQLDGSAPDRNYLPGKDYLPPPSADPPRLTNIINIEPPFGSSDQINNAINHKPETESSTKALPKRVKIPTPIRVKTTTEGYPNIEPAAAGNPASVIQPVTDKHENYSLARLCNDPFHSFLCTGATKQRERITGRLRPQAKIPANALNGQASFQNERKTLPARPIEPSPSKDNPSYLKPSTKVPIRFVTRKPFQEGFETQPASDVKAYLPPLRVNPQPSIKLKSNLETQAASDSRAYLPPTEKPYQPQSSIESRNYLPPENPEGSKAVQQRKQFSTKPEQLFNSISPSPSSSNNVFSFPISSSPKPAVINKDNLPLRAFDRKPQFTGPPQASNSNNLFNKFPQKSSSNDYVFKSSTIAPPITTTILPKPSKMNENYGLGPKISQPDDLDSRLYLPPLNLKTRPVIQPEPSSEDKAFLPPPVPSKPKFEPIIPQPAQQVPFNLLPKSSTVKPSLDNIVGAGAQSPISINAIKVTTERQHTLEELCNDSFHSFLCVPLKPRQRFNGRLRPQAKLPPGLVLPQSSNINEENRLPAPSSNDEQRIKPNYSSPKITSTPQASTVASTFKPSSPQAQDNGGYIYPEPSSNELFVINTTKRPLIHFEASDAFNPYSSVTSKEPKTITKSYSYSFSHTTTKKYNQDYSPLPSPSDNTARIMNLDDGYSYPKPQQPFTFPTTPTTPEVYPQPSNEQFQAIRPFPSKDGYNYPKPSNQLTLPSETPIDNEAPSPSNNFGTVLIPDNVKRKPKVKFTLPTTPPPTTTIRTTTEADIVIQPAAAQNPEVAVQVVKSKGDHHTLEEQCSHAFHSFLCNTPKRRRPRPDGRLYKGDSKPGSEISPAPSNSNPQRLRPFPTTETPKTVETSTKNVPEQPEPSSNQEQAIPFNGYNYPNPKIPFNQPIKSTNPPLNYAPSNPIEIKAPPPAQNGYSYPKPSPTFNIPIFSTTTKKVPELIKETEQSASFENVGYSYPKPTPSEQPPSVAEASANVFENVGYSYPKPSPSERLPSAANTSPYVYKGDGSKDTESTGYSYNLPNKLFTLPTTISSLPPTTTAPFPSFDIDFRSGASGDIPSYIQPAQNNFVPRGQTEEGYNYHRPDTSKQLQLPSSIKPFPNINLSPSRTIQSEVGKPSIPAPSISDQLPKFDASQFPFSFFKKSPSKPKVKDPLPRDSDLIILKL